MAWAFADWWKEHGDKLNNGRKFRYHMDEGYRDRVLKTNKDSRDRKKADQLRDRKDQRVVKSKGDAPAWKTIPLKDGTPAFTVGALAVRIERSIQTIRQWEKKGIILKTPHRTKRGDRLYTQEQIDQIFQKLKADGKLGEVANRPSVRTSYKVKEGTKEVERDLHQMGVLAECCHRSIVTMDLMESKGILPPTPFRYGGLGRRLFTGEMIEIVVEAFIAHGGEVRGDEDQKTFHDQVLTGWTGLGVMTQEVVQ